jgi:hypothetical protein
LASAAIHPVSAFWLTIIWSYLMLARVYGTWDSTLKKKIAVNGKERYLLRITIGIIFKVCRSSSRHTANKTVFTSLVKQSMAITLKIFWQNRWNPLFFPVDMDSLEGLVTFEPVEENRTIAVTPEVSVRTVGLHHPNGGIGYRLDHPMGSISYISDQEHPPDAVDPTIVDFVRDSTVLIHDAQYLPLEKKGSKSGWGHSSWEDAVLVAKDTGVKRLFLFHHDPVRTETELTALLDDARKIFKHTEIAREREVFTLTNGSVSKTGQEELT